MPLGITRRRWEDKIKIDPKDVRWEDMDWIYLMQAMCKRLAVVNLVVTFF